MYGLFSFFFLVSFSLADTCQNAPAPACPTSGVRVLDETRYPTRAFVISYSGDGGSRGLRTPVSATVATFRAFGFNPQSAPDVIITAEAADFQNFVRSFRDDLFSRGEFTEEQITALVGKIHNADTIAYTWQQDFFESTFDPATGNPTLQFSPIYDAKADGGPSFSTDVQKIAGAGVCGISRGPDFVSAYNALTAEQLETPPNGVYPKSTAEYGGNIEGLPGGLCLIGNNMLPAFAAQVCGPAENQVAIDVSWLQVGHVDEIFKSIPDRRNIPGRPAECAFTILSADTDLGYSLLRSPDASNRAVVNLRPAPGRVVVNNTGYESPGEEILCKAAEATATPATPSGSGSQGSRVDSAFVRFFMPTAHAVPPEDSCYTNLRNLTNSSFSTYLEGKPDLREYNRLIQTSLQRSRQLMYDKILGRLPQCRRFFPDVASMFTLVPNIFSPSSPDRAATSMTTVDGHRQLVHSSNGGLSVFPNPANALVMNNTVIFPGPQAGPYDDYLRERMRNLGLTTDSVDTWDYAHVRQGNIHCSSHVIPYCAPGGGR